MPLTVAQVLDYDAAKARAYDGQRLGRIVNAAHLDGDVDSESAASIYIDLTNSCLRLRVSDHARGRHHRASYERTAPDLSVVLMTADEAQSYLIDTANDRTWSRATILVCRRGQRAKTLGRHLRDAVARELIIYRRAGR